MRVRNDQKADTVTELIEESFDETCIVFSDKSTGYVNIADHKDTHITEKSDKQTTKTTLN